MRRMWGLHSHKSCSYQRSELRMAGKFTEPSLIIVMTCIRRVGTQVRAVPRVIHDLTLQMEDESRYAR